MLSSLYRSSDGSAPPLRVAVLVEREVLPRHHASALDDILASDFARLELVMVRAPAATNGEAHPAGRAVRSLLDPERRRRLLYDLYAGWDDRRGSRHATLAGVDCSERLSRVERLTLTVAPGAQLPQDALELLQGKRLDVILDLSRDGLGDGLESAARYGVWSYRWGRAERNRAGPPEFWELRDDGAVSVVALEARTTGEGKLSMCQALARTEPTLSVARNRVALASETAHFVIWKLHDLHRHGWAHVLASARGAEQVRPEHDRVPSNAEVAGFLAVRGARAAGVVVDDLRRYRGWQIGLRLGALQLCDVAGEASLSGFRWLPPPPGHYWADPVVVAWRGRRFLFVEDFQFQQRFHLRALHLRDGRGVIGCAELSASGELGPMRTVLDTGSHLSYPMVFADGEEMYLVPESGQAREVALYRATDFPWAWKKEAVLFDRCRAADTTVHHADGTWWFFTTLSNGDGSLKLMLFFADTLTGPWQQHPDNPISSDVRDCRCAGPIISRGGRLLRPSQSCAPEYGYSFTLNEIVELTRSRYRERPWRTVLPDAARGLLGTHQYSRCEGVEVTDGVVWLPVRQQDAPARVRRG